MIGYTTFKFYDDMDLDPGTYDYYVTAVYDEGESDPSNTVTAVVEEIISEECEYFDALTVGGYVAEQLGGMWTTWSNAPGTAEDAIVTDAQSYSAPNSFIVAPNVDMIFQFGNNPITTGAWLYSNMMYVASGTTGYFNVQSEPTPGVAWVIELYFNDGGAGQVIVDAVTTDFTYPQDEWIWVGVNIDLDNDAGDFWIDDAIVHSFVTANSIGGIDYFGAAATDGAYYDDVCFGEGYTIQPPVLPAPTDLTAEAVGEDIELNWMAPAGPVGTLLVVDRDGSADLAFTDDWQFIQPALDALGTDYTYYEVTDLTMDGPDLATMQQHDMILWLCGEGWQQSQTMSSNDENNLEAYLDGGGNLFLSGHDYLWDKYPSAGAFSPGQFPYDYLGVASVVQDNWFISSPATASASGVNGSFGEGIAFTVADIYTTDKDGLYIDQLTALDAGLFQVTSPAPTGVGAVQFDGGGFRTAFTTLSIAAITDQSDIEEVLAAAFGWFSSGDSDELLGYNIYHNLNGGAFSLLGNSTSTQYTHTAPGIGTHCYYVTAVYDEGESDPSNTDCETLTGIEDYLSSQVQVYPNPAKDAVHIQSDGEIQSIVVYNFSGQVAYEKEVHSTHFTINVSQFNPGVYLFRIRTEGETITQRIVVE
jgi:hypothetical protein